MNTVIEQLMTVLSITFGASLLLLALMAGTYIWYVMREEIRNREVARELAQSDLADQPRRGGTRE